MRALPPTAAANASYTPDVAYNEGDGDVTATRSATGTYAITFDGQDFAAGGHVQLGAQAQGRRCNVASWAGATVNLTCANAGGTAQDNNYGIVVVR